MESLAHLGYPDVLRHHSWHVGTPRRGGDRCAWSAAREGVGVRRDVLHVDRRRTVARGIGRSRGQGSRRRWCCSAPSSSRGRCDQPAGRSSSPNSPSGKPHELASDIGRRVGACSSASRRRAVKELKDTDVPPLDPGRDRVPRSPCAAPGGRRRPRGRGVRPDAVQAAARSPGTSVRSHRRPQRRRAPPSRQQATTR